MNIEYKTFRCIPNSETLQQLNQTYEQIFNTELNISNRLASKSKVVIIIAEHEQRIVGFKIGYEINKNCFYSWLGGVVHPYRKLGIASSLMKRQHDVILLDGYNTVRTKTLNKWKNMLILNLRNGFDIKWTYLDDLGEIKIVLEKKL